tara:strand:- start:252 stop:521 length:270 start_codon:yes stop_codon:yes gene_type:complete
MSLKKTNHKTLIIAEIGVNHNGNIKLAKKLIDVAKISGADYAKFQMYEPNEIVTEYAKKTEYQNLSMGVSITQKKCLRNITCQSQKLKN